MSTKTPAPAVTNSDAAMMDAQTTPPAPHELTQETHVSAKTWEAMTREDQVSHAAKLRRTHDTAATTKREMLQNLVHVAARLYAANPKFYQAKNGNFKGSALVNYGLSMPDLSVGSDIRTAVNKSVPKVVDSGLDLYGEPSAELVALLNAYDVNAKHRRARSKAKGDAAEDDAAEGDSEGDAAKGDARETDKQTPQSEPASWAKAQTQAVALAETVAALEGTFADPEVEVELEALLERTLEAIRSN